MRTEAMIRRDFLKTSAIAGFGLWATAACGAAGSWRPGRELNRASGASAAGVTIDDRDLLERVLRIHQYVEDRMIHPKTNMIYNNIDWEADDRWEKADFESPEEVRSKEASNPRRANPDDCAIRAGAYLAALADWYDGTGSPECMRQARMVFRGAKTLHEVAPRKGFIARGAHPADGISHPLNSSVDQYTWYVYGLWKYYRSGLSSQAEKEDIKKIINDICARIENDGFDIRNARGAPARVSDIGVIRSDRSSRLLEMYIVGHDITGNEHWREIYKEKVRENGHGRLRSILDPEQVMWPYTRTWARQVVGAVLQTQVSLVPLFELETDITIKACYLEAMRINAKLAEGEPAMGRTAGLHIMLLAHNLSLIAPVDCPREVRLGALLRERCSEVIAKGPSHNHDAAAAYWTAVRKGLFTIRR